MENFNLMFPISMVKKEERIVVGIATADNIDKAGDIVDFNASLLAFKNWAGNIREMHSPIAVGKAINYEPVKIKNADGEEFNAIRVEAYISKGAQDTWEKVLDGTLRAFSIGGRILEKEVDTKKVFRGKPANVIKRYELGELSLVDNPANQIAVIDIVKMSNDGELDYILKVDCNDIDLTIPDAVRKAAQAGLNQRKEHGRGGTSVGLGSARRLAAGGKATPEFVRKVAKYFPRHEVDKQGKGWNPGEEGYPSNGRIAWNLWGGDAGWAWARSKTETLNNCTTKSESDFDIEKQECSCGCSVEKEGEISTGSMGSGIANPTQGYTQEPSAMKPRRRKKIKVKRESNMIKDDSVTLDLDSINIENNKLDASENDIIELLNEILEMQDSVELDESKEIFKTQDQSLQNDVEYDTILNMDEQEYKKLSLLKRFVNWLVQDVEETASTESKVEVTENTLEEEMDIEILKDALGAVVDEKLANFATSIKEEVEVAVQEKIDSISKSFEVQKTELEEKLSATEKALAEQEETVKAIAASGAIKKSVDVEEEDDEVIVKSAPASIWNNVYLPQGLITALGYES